MLKRWSIIAMAGAAAFATLATSQTAAAADEAKEYVIDKEAAAANADKDGIEWGINAGATLNLTDTRSVVGQTDGTSLTFGFNFKANLDVYEGDHEWRNGLGIAAGITRTPTVPEFVKSQDNIDLESIYLYHITDWFGVFGRLAWGSAMFRGADIRPGPTDYRIAKLDGTVAETCNAAAATADNPNGCPSRLGLTDPLMPSRFKQSLGVFAQPIAEEPFSLEARVGGGGRETLANGQLALNDDADTADVIEIVELDDVFQLGAEGVLEVWGTFEDKKFAYKAGAEVMIPFVNNDADGRDGIELMNVLLYGGLSVKVVEWASLDYNLRAMREPQLLDAWQVQNQLLFTMGIAAGSATEE